MAGDRVPGAIVESGGYFFAETRGVRMPVAEVEAHDPHGAHQHKISQPLDAIKIELSVLELPPFKAIWGSKPFKSPVAPIKTQNSWYLDAFFPEFRRMMV